MSPSTSSPPSCPVGTKVSVQTVKNTVNTLSCYDSTGTIIGSPIPSLPSTNNICARDSRISNYATHIDTGYIQCKSGNVMRKETNPCPTGYNAIISSELSLNGSLTYTCQDNKIYEIVDPFTCPLNVTPNTVTVLWDGSTAYQCNILPISGFTSNIYDFKSKKERNIENFSQNTNGKCKARY
jgi:hypothetical protein